MKILLGIQARSNSTRLPGKIYKDVYGKPMLERVWDICKEVNVLSKAIETSVAVVGPIDDKKLEDFCSKRKYELLEGPEEDVIRRYLEAVEGYHAVVRITGDCPFVPPQIVAQCVTNLADVDYTSNTCIRSFPEGWDVQGASTDAMHWFDHNQEDREHPFKDFDENAMVRGEFVKYGLTYKHIINPENCIFEKTSIDTEKDLARYADAK